MLRKAAHLCIRQVGRSSFPSRNSCYKFSVSATSHSDSHQKSVLVEPEVRKPKSAANWNLQSVLSLQQNEKLSNIQKIDGLPGILNFLKNNDKIIAPLYAPIFEQVWRILQGNSAGMSKEKFVSSPEFERFCVNVKKSVRAIRPSDTLNILKTLKFLNVSMNSVLCQHLLQILSKHVNDLSLRQIAFASYLLHNVSSSPIVEVLKLSIPIVFDANVRNKLDHSNITSLIEALNFAAFNKASYQSIDIIVNAIWEFRETLTCSQAKEIVLRLCKIKILNKTRKSLYNLCLSKINQEMMEQLTYDDIHNLTSFIIHCFLFHHRSFYNEIFLLNVSKYILHHKLGLRDIGKILQQYNRISYVSIELLDYIDAIINKPDSDIYIDQFAIMTFISSCSNARYKPLNWVLYENKILDMLLSNDSFEPYLLRTTLELITLQCWSLPLIEKVFSPNFINDLSKKGIRTADYLTILNLYQQVLTLYPGKYEGILPPTEVVEKAKEIMKDFERDEILRPALEKLFGGENFVINGLTTQLGHTIDNLVVLRKDGRPFPLREHGVKDGQHLEDIVAPPNSYSCAVMVQKPTSYCIDGVRFRGRSKTYIDSIEALGVIAIPLSLNVWESLEDHEKLPYLKREIFSRIDAPSSSSEIT